MPNRDHQPPNYSLVEGILSAIADWVNKYRNAFGLQDQLGLCRPEEVMLMAKDLGVTPEQFRELARKGPDAADQLTKILIALHVDPNKLAHADPIALRDMQRLCTTCGDKRQCEHALADGTAAEHFREFCPNAVTLDTLFDQPSRPVRH